MLKDSQFYHVDNLRLIQQMVSKEICKLDYDSDKAHKVVGTLVKGGCISIVPFHKQEKIGALLHYGSISYLLSMDRTNATVLENLLLGVEGQKHAEKIPSTIGKYIFLWRREWIS